MKMLLKVCNVLLFMSCQKGDSYEIDLYGSKNNLSLSCHYEYLPTTNPNIFYVNRTILSLPDSINWKHSYYIFQNEDTTFIGKKNDENIYFLPYLISNPNLRTTFNFNNLLDSFSQMNMIMGLKNNQILKYKGYDFGNYTNGPIELSFENGLYVSEVKISDRFILSEISRKTNRAFPIKIKKYEKVINTKNEICNCYSKIDPKSEFEKLIE